MSMTGIHQAALPEGVARGVTRGDRAAVTEAYRILSQPVMNLAARILQDRGLAEEVVQDTFMDLVEKANQIREATAVAGWVRQVATNHCLMRLRSPWLARRDSLPDDHQHSAHEPDEVVQGGTLEKALASLPGETRAVIWLHDVEGYTHKEIGEMLGKTTSFSKSQLARGYARLLQWSRETQQNEPRQHTKNTDTGNKHNVENTDARLEKHAAGRCAQRSTDCLGSSPT